MPETMIEEPQSSFVAAFAAKAKNKPAGRRVTLPTASEAQASPEANTSNGSIEEPAPPSLEVARARLEAKLPRDPVTGTPVATDGYGPRLVDFEFLGLGVYSYVSHLHRSRVFFTLLALLSVSSLVANGYGGELGAKQLNAVTWLFTGASLGNAHDVAPPYGASELLMTTLMTLFLFFSVAKLNEDAHRVESKQVTPADFTVQISGLPRELPAAPIEAALAASREIEHLHVSIVAPLHQHELIVAQRELTQLDARRAAYAADALALTTWRDGGGSLSPSAEKRLAKLHAARDKADVERTKLLAAAKAHVDTLPADGPTSAGVAYVTFADAHDAISLLDLGEISLPDLGERPFQVSRPPEPSDVIWENLGCDDALRRQVKGTLAMSLLSCGGALLIGASAYLQPKATESNAKAHKGISADLTVLVVGTLVLLAGYLVVFITVPIVEVAYMRHTSVTQKEVSQVLKLVGFQVLATLSTIGSFIADTAGSLNRDWYITGGFMLVNGMMVDLFVITCLIQGWGLVLNVGRLVLAPNALTQVEMDAFYAGDGANMYVVDRLQMVTKFMVMCYICSAALPLLHWVVLLVLAISITIDEHNLLRRLYPAPQSDESVVKVILTFVMPLAILAHLAAAHVFFAQLEAPSAAASSPFPLVGAAGGSVSDAAVPTPQVPLVPHVPGLDASALLEGGLQTSRLEIARLLNASSHGWESAVHTADSWRSAEWPWQHAAWPHVNASASLTALELAAQSLVVHAWSTLGLVANDSSALVGAAGLGLGSEADDGMQLVGWSVWVNVPLVLLFMLREWPRYGRTAAARANDAAAPNSMRARALVGRALAGSVWSSVEAPQRNAALAFTHDDLQWAYTKAHREAELRYASPDTSQIIALCRAAAGDAPA